MAACRGSSYFSDHMIMSSRHSADLQDQDKSAGVSSGGWDKNAAEGPYYHQNGRLVWDNYWENPTNLSQNPLFVSSTGHVMSIADNSRISSPPFSAPWPTHAAGALRHLHSQLFQAPSFTSDSNASMCAQTPLRSSGPVQQAFQNMVHASEGYEFSGISGASNISNELKCLQQRHSEWGVPDHYQRTNYMARDLMKAEDLFFQGNLYERIGLNLGGRTYFSPQDSIRMGKRTHLHGSAMHLPICQAQGCTADLSRAKHYYRRHKVCEMHSKASHVLANGQSQRFCQQCSRLHLITEFDDAKRSCRKRLADHNRRRRKPQVIASQSDSCTHRAAFNLEDKDQMAALCSLTSKDTPEAKPEAGHNFREAISSSEVLEELTGSTNGLETQSLDYEFFRAECNSGHGHTLLQLNDQKSESTVSDTPSLRLPADRHHSSGNLMQFPVDIAHFARFPSPEINRSNYNSLDDGAIKPRDSSLPFSLLETTVADFENRYDLQLEASAFFDQQLKISAPWLVQRAHSKPVEEITRSPKD